MPKKLIIYFCFVFLLVPWAAAQSLPTFISFEAAQPTLTAGWESLPDGLGNVNGLDNPTWSRWIRNQDRTIRARLDRGEEDTLTNLLRFGVTFTKELRIYDQDLVRYGSSTQVDASADRRADDLIVALRSPGASEGMLEMRGFVKKKGFSFTSPQEIQRVRNYLLNNLARMRDDFIKYHNTPKDARRFQLFQDRGISLDTNLWPDYQLELSLRDLLQKGLLHSGSVHRVAIVGPGLDFVNKEAGSDFYPPQTIQPFAVIDSLVRLGLADPHTIQLYTFDISPQVNVHLAGTRRNAIAGRPYTLQLPWNTSRPMSDEFRAGFIAYWQSLGSAIGKTVAPIPVPKGADGTQTRAIKISPKIAQRITPVDMNIVFQRLELPSQEAFDLIIGTSIFVYYNAFEQSLARANVAAMLKPGGYLLSNDKLPDFVPSGMEDVLETKIEMSHAPLNIVDYIFCYRRQAR
jgi:hypothetical protein